MKLRFFLLAASLLLALGGCSTTADEVLPVASSIKGRSFVSQTEVIVRQPASGSVTALDRKAGRAENPAAYSSLAFEELLRRMIETVTRSSGLTSGRALKLIVEVDSLRAPTAGGAFLGADDQLAGTVFIRDARTDEELGQLYVDVGRPNGGFLSLVTRGGGMREQLAEAFAKRIATALGGREAGRR